MNILSLENVSKHYRRPHQPDVPALRDIHLSLAPGMLRVIAGPSGSGKSTLLLCAGGLLHPDNGRVVLDGKDLYQLTAEERSVVRAQTIGFVFQQFHLIPFLNVRDNILVPTLSGAGPGDTAKRADALIEQFGLEHRRHHPTAELSVGERQRVALARALIFNPKILLADEPTGNLDTDNGRRVMDTLDKFTRNGGAVLLVTHDPRVDPSQTWRLEAGELIQAE